MSVMDTTDYQLYLKRSADGAADVTVDYFRVLFGTLTYINNDIADGGDNIWVHESNAYLIDNPTSAISKILNIQGDIFELLPDTLNHVILLTGDLGSDTVLTATTTVSRLYITPRWALA